MPVAAFTLQRQNQVVEKETYGPQSLPFFINWGLLLKVSLSSSEVLELTFERRQMMNGTLAFLSVLTRFLFPYTCMCTNTPTPVLSDHKL